MHGRLAVVALFAFRLIGAADADASAEALRAGVVLEADEINSSTVEVGAFVVVVYGKEKPHPILREWEKLVTTRGYVQAVDAETLTLALERNGTSQRIALDRIQTLTLVGSPFSEATKQDSVQVDANNSAVGGSRETLKRLSVKTDDMGTSRRVASKLVAGTLSGIGGFFGGFVLGDILDDGSYTHLILGIWIGYPVGSAIGVSLVEPQDQDRFIHPLIGSFLGFGAADPTKFDINDLIFPTILATLASELSRFDNLPPIFMSRSLPKSSRFSIGLVPSPKGHLSAVAKLRF